MTSVLETISTLADYLGFMVVNGLNPSRINDRLDAIQTCTVDEIEDP